MWGIWLATLGAVWLLPSWSVYVSLWLFCLGAVAALEEEDLLGEGLALIFQIFVEPFEEVAFDEGLVEFFAGLLELISEEVGLPDDIFKFLFVDFETVGDLKIDHSLPEFGIFLFEFADGDLEVLDSGDIDLSWALGVVGGLRIGEEGLLAADVMEACLDIPGFGGAVAGGSFELLENLILAQVAHSL